MRWSFDIPSPTSVMSLTGILTDAVRKNLRCELLNSPDSAQLELVVLYNGKRIGEGVKFTPKNYRDKELIEETLFHLSKIEVWPRGEKSDDYGAVKIT